MRDKTRPSRIVRLGPDVRQGVVALTLADPPGETTHWTADMMATAAGVSASAVRRIWKAHGLAPHRWRRFKSSNDQNRSTSCETLSASMLIRQPTPSCCRSIEKSQIQALDRTQPGLPMKKGRLGTMTHDYKRHGTTTLFAALNVLDGTVIGRNMQRHRHQEFVRFLNAINAQVPDDKAVHVVLDDYLPQHPKVRASARPSRRSPPASLRLQAHG
ncbi:IS630 family transposase [Rhizobium sp. K7/93]